MDLGADRASPSPSPAKTVVEKLETRSIPFSIDLNEIPSPSSDAPSLSSTPTTTKPPSLPLPPASLPPHATIDAYTLACKFHANPQPPPGLPAEFPGEAGVGGPYSCGACERNETRGATLLCDGCEQGFHLGCLGLKFNHLNVDGEWVCGRCMHSGCRSKRWPLGTVYVGPKRRGSSGILMLDINALPPSEGDGDFSVNSVLRHAVKGHRKEILHEDYASTFDEQVRHPETMHIGNGILSASSNCTMAKRLKRTTEDGLLSSSFGEVPAGDSTPWIESTHLQQKMFLQSLKEFISDRHGYLSDGWHVEFRKLSNQCSPSAIYCSPDGKKFESMFDVSCYLGLTSNHTCTNNDDITDSIGVVKKSSCRRRRRKELARLSRTSSYLESQDTIMNDCGGDVPNTEVIDNVLSSGITCLAESVRDEDVLGSFNSTIRFPVQYEDMSIIHVGRIENRPGYHSSNQIWPLGYKSTWHDKITGSLFECELSDGGASGPVFRVRRCSCSNIAIPEGETILFVARNYSPDVLRANHCNVIDTGYVEDDQVPLLLSDPFPSGEDLLSCLENRLDEGYLNIDKQKENCWTSQPSYPLGATHSITPSTGMKDNIGVFCVEGNSSSSVWRMVSQKFVDICKAVYNQSHDLHFLCPHRFTGTSLLHSNDVDTKYVEHLGSLARFCYAAGPIDTPPVIESDIDFSAACESISKWLNEDRFGLDLEFSQEIIEQLPGAENCKNYNYLRNRKHHLRSQSITSGFLLAKRRNPGCGEKEVIPYDSYLGSSNSKILGHNAVVRCTLPPGQALQSSIPEHLLGDVLQIWELFWRFYEILGLEEPFSLEELEAEIIDPWSCCYSTVDTTKKDDDSLQGNGSTRSCSYSSTVESDSAGYEGHTFIPVMTESVKEAANAKAMSHTFEKCTGIVLTKAHISLLKVLVGELQSKVAVFADPNSDIVESKPRRGRRRDVENSISVKKPKIDLLPINELTWPELARRYVLAVSVMDCNTDSVEMCSREGAKVFRCLQGDGGILCGSLSGVVGMEADALLLAEAEKQISHYIRVENDVFSVEFMDSEVSIPPEPAAGNNDVLPEWAQVLVPVRKLPTNVGTRIRKCVYDSLDKDPPDWAKKILEHSISKEVYKGNASGPTKKAVLKVLALAAADGESLHEKPSKHEKVKHVDSLSNVVMKQCRIVLRRIVSADEAKVFSNLLGTVLSNTNDNDDEGILGSPGMVSRPIDFRTVDLRLKVGAYCGSHDAYLEDVLEIWRSLRIAYGDKPDLMELVESLSKKFQLMYEEEVLSLVQSLVRKMESEDISFEAQKKLDSLVCADELPKAPWEDGVCKVCGIDKDDDSVLLCDTCDSEYHTYCLIPPLSKIPAGNWYCPSCVACQQKSQDLSDRTNIINKKQKRRLGGEVLNLKESLSQLAVSLEQRDYWDLNMEERIYLLKFLCDEVLNSIIIREHLDQCTDISTELQQKLRSLSLEWKTLKYKEAILTTMIVNESTSRENGICENVREEVLDPSFTSYVGEVVHQQSLSSLSKDDTNFLGSFEIRSARSLENNHVNEALHVGQKIEQNEISDVSEHLGLPNLEIIQVQNGDSDSKQIADTYGHVGERDPDILGLISGDSGTHANLTSGALISCRGESDKQKELPLTNGQMEGSGEVTIALSPSNVKGTNEKGNGRKRSPCLQKTLVTIPNKKPVLGVKKDDSLPTDIILLDGSHDSFDNDKGEIDSSASPVPICSTIITSLDELPSLVQNSTSMQRNCNNVTDSKSCTAELDIIKDEISRLQGAMTSLELQILKSSPRRDFLGRDSDGRIFWGISRPGRRPWLLVDGTAQILKKSLINDHYPMSSSVLALTHSSVLNDGVYRRANLLCPGNAYSDQVIECLSPWILYESDTDIQELVDWLREVDPREKELKESILQWRLRPHQVLNPLADGSQIASISEDVKNIPRTAVLTKASLLLEQRYGPCLEFDASYILKKKGRKLKTSNELKMYRCECLEPVWPSRDHCPSCHQTFSTNTELEDHNEENCTSSAPGFDETRHNGISKGKNIRSEGKQLSNAKSAPELPLQNLGNLHLKSKFVKFRKKVCPYNFEEISCKFITNDSNKDLVQAIGFLGSNGSPSFIETAPYHYVESNLMVKPTQKQLQSMEISSAERFPALKEMIGRTPSNPVANGSCHSEVSARGYVLNETHQELRGSETENLQSINDRELVSSVNRDTSEIEGNYSCTISESSLTPLYGRVSQILVRLKINLLDMEAALPKEAVRLSKSSSTKRSAWRALVKSAQSLYEMVQATILLEGMIKTEYMRNEQWFWSSLAAAAKTSTISSLALRIYSLDASIIYDQESKSDMGIADNIKMSNKVGKKRKDIDSGS